MAKTDRPFLDYSWRERAVLLWGKIRRFLLGKLRPGYVLRMQAARQGDCTRCGSCCKLLYQCPFLDESSFPAMCTIHETRPENCRIFPVDSRDLTDRNFVQLKMNCGYSFPEDENPHGTRDEYRPGAIMV